MAPWLPSKQATTVSGKDAQRKVSSPRYLIRPKAQKTILRVYELEIPGALGCYENKSMKHECLCYLHVTEYDTHIPNTAMNIEHSKRFLRSFD
jgi:hypothetical protein